MFFFVCLCISFPQDNSLTIQTAQHRWNCLHCSCCFLLFLLLWRGSALHTCLPSGLDQVNSHPSQQRRRLLWGCHSTIIHSFTVCSGAYSFHKCFFVLVCTCVCVCLLLPAWNGGRRMAQIGECLRLTLVSRLKASAEDNQIPLRMFNMYTLTVTGKLERFIQTARAPGTVVGFICAADCKGHNKEHSDFISGSLLDELSPIQAKVSLVTLSSWQWQRCHPRQRAFQAKSEEFETTLPSAGE